MTFSTQVDQQLERWLANELEGSHQSELFPAMLTAWYLKDIRDTLAEIQNDLCDKLTAIELDLRNVGSPQRGVPYPR